MTILPLLKCYDPRHKTTRADTAAWYRRTMLLARKTFGGFSSESGFDFAADSLDFILYSFFKTRWDPLPPVCDARVPFWPIVYHGIVLYNPGTFTLNYPVKTPRSRLHFFELGGRPLACFYANFASNSHWMGEEDLYADTDEYLADAAERIRMMADDFDRMQEVRYSFIREHEQIAPDVFRTTYENDASVTVDYSTGVAALRGADGRETLLV